MSSSRQPPADQTMEEPRIVRRGLSEPTEAKKGFYTASIEYDKLVSKYDNSVASNLNLPLEERQRRSAELSDMHRKMLDLCRKHLVEEIQLCPTRGQNEIVPLRNMPLDWLLEAQKTLNGNLAQVNKLLGNVDKVKEMWHLTNHVWVKQTGLSPEDRIITNYTNLLGECDYQIGSSKGPHFYSYVCTPALCGKPDCAGQMITTKDRPPGWKDGLGWGSGKDAKPMFL